MLENMHKDFCTFIEKERIEYVINADEIPVVWDMSFNKTLHHCGDPEVLIRKIEGNKKRITVILGVIYSTKWARNSIYKCKSMIIYRGKTSRTIKDVQCNDDQLLRFNSKAWCTEREFSDFIMNAIPKELPPSKTLLVYDGFSGHTTQAVNDTIKKLGYHKYILPPNSTAFAQPLDVAINRPFKHFIRACYQQWMVDNLTSTQIPQVTKELLRQWVQQSFNHISEQLIKRAFECVGIGTHYLDHSKVYWRKLRSLQQNLEKSTLPSVRELIQKVFADRTVSDEMQNVIQLYSTNQQ